MPRKQDQDHSTGLTSNLNESKSKVPCTYNTKSGSSVYSLSAAAAFISVIFFRLYSNIRQSSFSDLQESSAQSGTRRFDQAA